MPAATSSKALSFRQFVLNNPINRRLLMWGFGLCVIQFIIFKLLYPYPDFFSDSYSYIFAASAHLDVSIWPIGYSKFLDVFHRITWSDTALVGFQYFFIQIAALYFYFSTLYLFQLQPWTKKALFLFSIVNPLTLYLSNTVNSDALFGALSLLWFTELLWLLRYPRPYHIFFHALLLFLCFAVRNNAYYYPLITGITFLLSRYNLRFKLAGLVLPFLLIVPFVIHTQNKAYDLTGVRQYSLFTGWQLANNALYIYDQVKVDSMSLPSNETRQLNRLAIDFFRHTNPATYRDQLVTFQGNLFIKHSGSPLKRFFRRNYPSKSELEVVKNWGKASAVYDTFGKAIILHHPIAYLRYFVLPNTWHYFMPPLLHLALYNYGGTEIDPAASKWFHYRDNQVHCVSFTAQEFLVIYMAFFFLFNVYFIWQSIRYFQYRRSHSFKGPIHRAYLMSAAFILCNFIFSILVTVNILRYQFIPMFILLTAGLVLNDFLIQYSRSEGPNVHLESKKTKLQFE